MKTLFILLSSFLLIFASHLTDAAAIAGAQKVDSTIEVPPPQGLAVDGGLNGQLPPSPYYHPDFHFGNDDLNGQPFSLPYHYPSIHFGNDGGSGKTPPGNDGPAPTAASHPNELLQWPNQFPDIQSEAERSAAWAAGKAVGDVLGKVIGDLFSNGCFSVVPPPANSLKQQQQQQQQLSASTNSRDAVERSAAWEAGEAVGRAAGMEVGDALRKAIGDLFSGSCFLAAPPPINSLKQQQQPPAAHPNMLLQRLSVWTNVRDATKQATFGR